MPTIIGYTLDGFEHYEIDTNEVPASFIIFVTGYCVVALLTLAPLTCWSQISERRKQERAIREADRPVLAEEPGQTREQEMIPLGRDINNISLSNNNDAQQQKYIEPSHIHSPPHIEPAMTEESLLERPLIHNTISDPTLGKGPTYLAAAEAAPLIRDDAEIPTNDRGSNVPSVASTSRLHEMGSSGRQLGRKSSVRAWDLGLRRSQNKPLRPAESMRRNLRAERQSVVVSEEGSQTSRSRASYGSRVGGARNHSLSQRGLASNVASTLLEQEMIEGEAQFYRQRYIERARSGRRSESTRSVMERLSPDILTPDDAADAHDQGTANRLEDYDIDNSGRARVIPLGWYLEGILELAEPDYERRRIFTLAIPATAAAMAEPLFRLVLAAIVSHFINTNSMVAYVLVMLFVRLTTAEISGAVADAESNLVQDALSHGGDYGFELAGQHVLVGIVYQLLIGIPVLVLWVYLMDDVVLWLVGSVQIATVAAAYTEVVVVDYILRGATRSFMLPFHLSGQARFETNVDLAASLCTVVAISAIAASTRENRELSLRTIGWIQVILGIAKTFVKVSFVVFKGWTQPYRRGLTKLSVVLNPSVLLSFLLQVLPVLIGSLCELGEWELLVLAIGHLGGPQVSAWALMGIVWEIFLASTEGLGEASAVRVSYYLAENMPVQAKQLANKVMFLAAVEALVVTSVFYMAGPNIVVALTTDASMQNLLNDLIGLTGLASVCMTFAQVYWSLTGAQNRFGLASATMLLCRWFIIAPMASVCVFVYRYDVRAVAGAIAIGYATATFALAWFIFWSDWKGLSAAAQEQLLPLDDDENLSDMDDEDDDDEDYDDDEDGDPFDDDDSDSDDDIVF